MENIERLGLAAQVTVIKADLFPEGKAPLVVCNPPWLPAEPTSPVEYAVYDPDSRMLRGFLAGLAAHLADGGEGWLVISDIAELLGLRSRQQLLAWIDGGPHIHNSGSFQHDVFNDHDKPTRRHGMTDDTQWQWHIFNWEHKS